MCTSTVKPIFIKKAAGSLLITPKLDSWEEFFKEVPKLFKDFDMPREKSLPQRCEEIKK